MPVRVVYRFVPTGEVLWDVQMAHVPRIGEMVNTVEYNYRVVNVTWMWNEDQRLFDYVTVHVELPR